jgi:hypothetical protein
MIFLLLRWRKKGGSGNSSGLFQIFRLSLHSPEGAEESYETPPPTLQVPPERFREKIV